MHPLLQHSLENFKQSWCFEQTVSEGAYFTHSHQQVSFQTLIEQLEPLKLRFYQKLPEPFHMAIYCGLAQMLAERPPQTPALTFREFDYYCRQNHQQSSFDESIPQDCYESWLVKLQQRMELLKINKIEETVDSLLLAQRIKILSKNTQVKLLQCFNGHFVFQVSKNDQDKKELENQLIQCFNKEGLSFRSLKIQ